ncbi:MAG: hypothetical protein Kow0068_23670 [Marinilabiliales bacterium]
MSNNIIIHKLSDVYKKIEEIIDIYKKEDKIPEIEKDILLDKLKGIYEILKNPQLIHEETIIEKNNIETIKEKEKEKEKKIEITNDIDENSNKTIKENIQDSVSDISDTGNETAKEITTNKETKIIKQEEVTEEQQIETENENVIVTEEKTKDNKISEENPNTGKIQESNNQEKLINFDSISTPENQYDDKPKEEPAKQIPENEKTLFNQETTEPSSDANKKQEVTQPDLFNTNTSESISQQGIKKEPSIGEKYMKQGKKSLNDILSEIRQNKDIATQMQYKKIDDLKSVISLNDKIRFIKDLFGGVSSDYNKTIDFINGCKDLDEAMDYINKSINWNDDNQSFRDFLELIYRRHLPENL